MTFAWYTHLKNLNNKSWIIAALVSWGIALAKYLFQMPANRIAYRAPCFAAVSDALRSSKLNY